MNEVGAVAVYTYGMQFQERCRLYPHITSNVEMFLRDLDVDRQFLLSEQSPKGFAWAICPLGTWISAARNAFIRADAFGWWNRGSWHGPHEFFLCEQGSLQEVSILEFLAWIGPRWEQRDLSTQEQDRVAYHQQMVIDAKKNVTHAKLYLRQYSWQVSDLDGTS